ncbi:hypothetical protein O9993_11360 [Vibrio lentus]|nr:hypothetical protein [Vibrio lentus]
MGGQNSKVHFSMIAQEISPTEATSSKSLCRPTVEPVDPQPTVKSKRCFKTIYVLIPIGALIVVFLRSYHRS